MSDQQQGQRNRAQVPSLPNGVGYSPPSPLFPLDRLLEELLQQEEVLWRRNEMHLQALRAAPANLPVAEHSDVSSVRSMATLRSQSSAPTPAPDDGPRNPNQAGLYLISYGTLTNVIHKYFRRLEKRHACLYLTGRQARHESLRHVETHRALSSEEDALVTMSASALLREGGQQLVTLKDEELLVYRCALMCSQFPMLSAPSPPEGHSPTPTPPALPLRFHPVAIGSLHGDIARTAPEGYLTDLSRTRVEPVEPHPQRLPDPSHRPSSERNLDSHHSHITTTPPLPTTPPHLGRTSSGDTLKALRPSLDQETKRTSAGDKGDAPNGVTRTSSGERGKSKPRVVDGREPLESPESSRKPLLPEMQSARHPTSSPVPIRGHKARSRNNSTHAGRDRGKREGDSAANKKLTSKRHSSPLHSAVVDSDEEDEIVKLTSHNGKPSSAKAGSSIMNGPLYREHPFSPMVNREMLCNLVRNAFHQTEEQQLQFEQILRHEYGRRSKGEILAKELAGQLQVLENNAHPFYKPKLFVTRNGYDIWLQAEKQRVRTLIDKFWHFSLPRPQLWRHYNPTDYHRAYAILLQKIICIESRTERKEPAYTGRTPSAPLSATAHRLLTEFGLRYGVGVLYRRIVYLDYLAKHFDYEIWYIKHCTEELREIRELLPRNRNKITAVRKEMELLRSTVHLLHGQTDNSLTRIDRLFLDTDPREGVASLIELLAEVLDAEQSLFGKKVRPVEDWLKRYLKSGFALRYMRRKEIAADETMTNRTAQPFVLTPPLVNALLLSIRDEVREYREKFQPVFRPYFDIVPFSKVEFYQLLCSDACNLCARMTHRPETRQSLSLEMLGLMYRLNERDMEWENVITPELQLWRRGFVDLALIWMEVLGKQINQWIRVTVARDQWTMLTFASSVPTSQDASRPSTETIPTPQILAGMRNSPFPSPTFSNHAGTASVLGSLGSAYGAFSPYPRAVLKRHTQKTPPQSESSGAVTDISNSTSSMESAASIPIGEIPDVVLKGARKGAKRSPAGSLLNFGTGAAKGRGEEETVGFSSTVDPPEEIEVPASAYESYGSDSKSPSVNQEGESLAEATPELAGSGMIAPGSRVLELKEDKATIPCSEENPVSDKPNSVGVDTEDALSRDNPMLPQGELSLGNDLAIPDEGLEGHAAVTQNHVSPERDLASGPIDVVVQVLSPAEQKSHSLPTEVKTVQERKSKTKTRRSQKSSQRHATTNGDLNPNLLIDAMDPPASLSATGTSPMVKFGNILDRCTAEDVGVVKPRVVKPSRTSTSHVGFGQSEDESHVPPASVGTVPELAEWAKEHSRYSFMENGHSGSGSTHTSSSYRDSQDTPKKSPSVEVHSDVEGSSGPSTSPTSEEKRTGSSYRFPVSSSPIDIVTMLTRLSTFTGVLLGILTPKLKPHTIPPEDQKVAHEYPSEVATARQQAMQQWKLAQDMKTEFLKKLHKAMVNSLKLYADNLLCMDLCWWSGREAMKLLGEQMVHHLRRRKEMGEIWGCRHMVEARHGLHPLGIPCQKKSNTKFENITRDMCIRINNIHTLITVFTSLESHLHASSRTEVLKPTNPFGYISSDPLDLSYRGATQQLRPNVHTRQQSAQQTHLAPSDPFTRVVTGSFSWPSTASPGLGIMEPDERSGDSRQLRGGERERPESGFRSRESLHTLEYLRNVQKIQIRILCIRMNKFFKPALSLLLELKLGECSIEKRLYPLTTFLTRHRNALQKYIYPECFATTMKYMWDYILQDLEEEAVKLRTMRRPITQQAQMILQAFSHLVEFMHDRSNGLELDSLTSSSEYLLGLLEIMTRSTDQLISIFNKLSAPHFARSRLDLSRSPIPVDSGVLHALRAQLHTYKKCFTGKEFVDKILEMGRLYESMSENPSEADTDNQVPKGESSRNSSRLSTRVISSTGQPIVYTVQYATEVAQYLLNERILLPLPDTSSSTGTLTSATSSDEENTLGGSTPKDPRPFLTSMERKKGIDTTRPLRQGSDTSESPHLVPRISPLYPRYVRSAVQDRGRAEEQEREMPAPEFSYSSQTFYKFADVEDFESNMLYQSLILAASTRDVQGGSRTMEPDEPSEFHRARNSTLFLVYDLIAQRSRKERRANQFLHTPRAVTVAEQKKDSEISMNCDLIFKM